MISWASIKALEKQKNDLQLKINNIINSNNEVIHNINELKSQILVLDKGIEKILCINETELKQILNNKGNATRSFYELKDKYKKISKLKVATTKMLDTIEAYQNGEENINKKI